MPFHWEYISPAAFLFVLVIRPDPVGCAWVFFRYFQEQVTQREELRRRRNVSPSWVEQRGPFRESARKIVVNCIMPEGTTECSYPEGGHQGRKGHFVRGEDSTVLAK